MNQKIKKPQEKSDNKDIALYKDDDLEPKGRTKHSVETDWPTQERTDTPHKKRQIKRTENSRLP